MTDPANRAEQTIPFVKSSPDVCYLLAYYQVAMSKAKSSGKKRESEPELVTKPEKRKRATADELDIDLDLSKLVSRRSNYILRLIR